MIFGPLFERGRFKIFATMSSPVCFGRFGKGREGAEGEFVDSERFEFFTSKLMICFFRPFP